MNFNLSSILSNSLRMLNIANKALPLIKEMNPTFKTIKEKIGKYTTNNSKKVINTPKIKQESNNHDNSKKVVYQNNSLTFFK